MNKLPGRHSLSLLALHFLTVLGIACSSPLAAQDRDAEHDPIQQSRRAKVAFSDGTTKPLHYLEYLPEDYASEGPASPLLLFLHGRGECGEDLERVKVWGPPRLVESGTKLPFVTVSPQCASPGWDAVALKGLLDHVVAERNIDPQRIYVTGLSMGGYGTWDLVASHPDLIAAAIPICGGGDPRTCGNLVNVPIWAFHGDADRVVPLDQTRKMVDAIRDAGGNRVQMTIYEGVAHNSWKQTYENDEVFKWLLKHKLDKQDQPR